MVWSETRGKLIDLIPDESRPSAGKPVLKRGNWSWQQAADEAGALAERIDLSYVPREAVLCFVARPWEIAQQPGTQELIETVDRKVYCLDHHTVADFEEIRAVFTDFGVGEQQPHGFVMFRSRKPLDWESFALDLFGPPDGGAARKVALSGTTYYVMNRRAAYFLADERTLVTAGEAEMEEVIKSFKPRQAEPGWVKRWRRVERGQLALMVDIEAFNKHIGPELQEVPAERQELLGTIRPFWEESQQLFLAMRAEDGLKIEALFHCASVQAAQKVRGTIRAGSTLVLNLLDGQPAAQSDTPDDEGDAINLIELGRALLKEAKVTVHGTTVEWQSKASLE
jgi:hypothetical protein